MLVASLLLGSIFVQKMDNINLFLHSYQLPNINNQEARIALETATKSIYDEAQKSLIADYLAHTNSIAEKLYRMVFPAVPARLLIC